MEVVLVAVGAEASALGRAEEAAAAAAEAVVGGGAGGHVDAVGGGIH